MPRYQNDKMTKCQDVKMPKCLSAKNAKMPMALAEVVPTLAPTASMLVKEPRSQGKLSLAFFCDGGAEVIARVNASIMMRPNPDLKSPKYF